MPFVKVDYELTVAEPFVTMQLVLFNKESVADLQNDRTDAPPPHFKSKLVNTFNEAYIVNPSNQFIKVFAVAAGGQGFEFSMKVAFTVVDQNLNTLVDPFSPAIPELKATVNSAGVATLDQSVIWVKPK